MKNTGRNALWGLLVLCLLLPCGCSSFPWSKKKEDEIFSPKPAYQKYTKKETKSTTEPKGTLGEFLGAPRVSWN